MTTRQTQEEDAVERTGPVFNPPLYLQRYHLVRDLLYKEPGIIKVVDFGCAEGRLFMFLKNLPFAEEIALVDADPDCLYFANKKVRPLAWDYVFKRHVELTVKLYNGSVAEPDVRFSHFDAVVCIELIEHLQPECLEALPANVFGHIRPKIAVFTTPNSEFNVLFPNFEGFRHLDHKFEWNRQQFQEWGSKVIAAYPEYTVEYMGVGEPPPESHHLGFCTQVAVFRLKCGDSLGNSTMTQDKPYTLVDSYVYPARNQNPT